MCEMLYIRHVLDKHCFDYSKEIFTVLSGVKGAHGSYGYEPVLEDVVTFELAGGGGLCPLTVCKKHKHTTNAKISFSCILCEATNFDFQLCTSSAWSLSN